MNKYNKKRQIFPYINIKSLVMFFPIFLLLGCASHESSHQGSLKPITMCMSLPGEDSAYLRYPENKKFLIFWDRRKNLRGYKDQSGKIIIKAQFTYANNFVGSVADVKKQDVSGESRGWCTINTAGKVLYHPYFFDNGPDSYASDLRRFIEKGKIGFANRNGKIIIPASFDFAIAFTFSEPITVVCKGCKEEPKPSNYGKGCWHPKIEGGKWGVIDRRGNIIVPLEFDDYDSCVASYKNDANPSIRTPIFFKDGHGYELYVNARKEYKLLPSLTN